ncbi:dephospho-CoA kinase [Enterococcus plantarum]|uniref:Dephospho-CoA kinase n=1 Tax=Enterococcus plantarum TaxID=1077675 RepID=A0A2W3Z7P4_9ENTE|nr:dephospho-CoA kinase [Enterococcus plantarum]MBO0422104.1 dephospho-CoA kinase [Enterococcus plantarum]MBO0466739.1 dephospho-CoA kinase [Enterococcus plantarum]PZL75881.1 dephospho-CoA kinase [Enterococcus plantarum]
MGMVLGLTGGIATGKSTVVSVFRSLNFPIVDADIIAREIVEVGKPALKKVVAVFGSEILNREGALNRKKLGEIIFSDEKKRKKLNEVLSPFLKEAILTEINDKKDQAPLVIVDIPLLYEGGYDVFVDKVAVVYVPEEIQLVRLMKRDNLSEEQAQLRIDSQLPIEEKKQKANIIFDNQNSILETKNNVQKWVTKNIFG